MQTTHSANHIQPDKYTIFSICTLTIVFMGVYFILRAMPDAQCGFLHYEEIVHPDGSVEFCATNHAGFLDLTRLNYPVEMKLSTDTPPVQGLTQKVTLDLFTSGGMAIAPHELAITHTEKMHVMLIDPSLEDYHHVHPQPDGLDGRYTFEFMPQQGGAYQVFAEIVPLRTRRQVIASGLIETKGVAEKMAFERKTKDTVEGIQFILNDVPESLRTNIDYRLELDVLAADGDAAILEEIMGAKGHMVAFDAEKKGFAHMHPVDSVFEARSDNENSGLAFLFNVLNPGWYRLFAQVQIDGNELFGSFDLKVE